MVVPFVDVSHLAASSSFFSAVLQPLGLHFLASVPGSSVTYGAHGKAVLQIRQIPASASVPVPEPAPEPSPSSSSLVLTAPSSSAVLRFHACGLKANPVLRLSCSGQAAYLAAGDDGASRAVVHDLDGNSMEVVYPDPRHYTGNPVRKTQSTRDEVGRILDWNHGVASSATASASPSALSRGVAMSRRPQDQPQPQPARRTAPSDGQPHQSRQQSSHQMPPASAQPSPDAGANSGGFSTTTVVGALLGAAAGAALTYGLVSQEKSRVPRHEVDAAVGAAPGLPRRSTFPERLPERLPERHAPAHRGIRRHDDREDREKRHKFADDDTGEYTTRRIAYADVIDDHENAWAPPKYLPQRSHHDTATISHSIAKSTPRSRAVDDSFDTRSRRSSRMAGSRVSGTRSRSEAPLTRAPFVPVDLDQRSHAPSRHSAVPRSAHSRSHSKTRSRRPARESEQESYVSAQTHRSEATAREAMLLSPPAFLLGQQDLVHRSRAPSTASTAKAPASGGYPVPREPTGRGPSSYVSARDVALPLSGVGSSHAVRGPASYVSARDVPLPMSSVGSGHGVRGPVSYVSARDIALPMSGVGSSHANWDDDMVSVAPSDSISCVGSKTSRRSHRRH